MKTVCPYCEQPFSRIWEHLVKQHELPKDKTLQARWFLAKEILSI